MHHPMPHIVSATRPQAFLDPIHQRAHRRRVVRPRQRPREIVCLAQAFTRKVVAEARAEVGG